MQAMPGSGTEMSPARRTAKFQCSLSVCNQRRYSREFGEGREEREGEQETATPLAIHPFDSFRVGGKTSDRAGGTVAGGGDFGVAADLTRDGA